MSYGDTGYGCPSNVVVRNEKRAGNRAENADLMPDVFEVRPGRRLDLADELETSIRHGLYTIEAQGLACGSM